MISTQTQLNKFINSIKNENELAIDTEFKWTNTYYPKLCLVQIATKQNIDCIDILAIKDLEPLFEKLYQKECLWIAHSARNDIEVLYHTSKKLPTMVFDTQIGASLVNYPLQISYQNLTKQLQNIELEKAYTRLDWSKRPLPEKAIEYALDDVRYLLKNYHTLRNLLESEGKLNWTMQEGDSLLDINLYNFLITNAWKKVKGFANIKPEKQNLAKQLSAWRELQAQKQNKPRKWLMSDKKLIDYALGLDKFSLKTQKIFNDFISNHPKITTTNVVVKKDKPATKTEKIKKQFLQNIVLQKAKQYNLNTQIIANNKSLLKYIRGDKNVDFLKGWRFELLKKELGKCKIV